VISNAISQSPKKEILRQNYVFIVVPSFVDDDVHDDDDGGGGERRPRSGSAYNYSGTFLASGRWL